MDLPTDVHRAERALAEMAREMTEILATLRSHALPEQVLDAAETLCAKVHEHAAGQRKGDGTELGAARDALRESNARFQVLTDAMPQMVWSTLPDGFHDYYNARWYEFTGVAPGSTDGEGWANMFHPDDQEQAWAHWRHSLENWRAL